MVWATIPISSILFVALASKQKSPKICQLSSRYILSYTLATYTSKYGTIRPRSGSTCQELLELMKLIKLVVSLGREKVVVVQVSRIQMWRIVLIIGL